MKSEDLNRVEVLNTIWAEMYFPHLNPIWAEMYFPHLNQTDKDTYQTIQNMIQLAVVNVEWEHTFSILNSAKQFRDEI